MEGSGSQNLVKCRNITVSVCVNEINMLRKRENPKSVLISVLCEHFLLYFYYLLFLKLKCFVYSINYFAVPHMNENCGGFTVLGS